MPQKKIGLALGSGSARGLAHIGIIRKLAEMGIRPAVVTGTSAGAIMGAAYASGNLDRFEEWVSSFTRLDVARFLDTRPMVRGGFIEGRRLIETLREIMGDYRIEELNPRFGAVATCLETGEEVWLTEGPLWDAVRMSIALPGLFAPGRMNDRWMVDGGVVNPVPVSLCRELGAAKIIAVNLNSDILNMGRPPQAEEKPSFRIPIEKLPPRIHEPLRERAGMIMNQYIRPRRETPSLQEVFLGSIHIMQDRITRNRIMQDNPDIILTPRLPDFSVLDVDRAEEAIAAGEKCVLEQEEKIRKLLL